MDLRQKAGVALLAVVSFSSVWTLMSAALELTRRQPALDGVSQVEARWQPLREALPRRGVIGYLSDVDPKDVTADQSEYLLAQYALAPVIVVRDSNQKFVIGNYRSTAPDSGPLAAKQLSIVREFGGGVYLLRRAAD